MKFKLSYAKGLRFGVASGIITTLGMMVGLASGTGSKVAVVGGILTIALADAMSDAFGIHLSEKSSKKNEKSEIWEATVATFLAKLIFASTFLIPVLFLELNMALWVSIGWGLLLLMLISLLIAHWRGDSKLRMVAEHWLMATVVITLTHFLGRTIAYYFN